MSATVEDFWRMVVEHNICTMVQLTADDPEAFKYWSPTDMPGSEVDFGAMKVTLVKIFIFTLEMFAYQLTFEKKEVMNL